MEYISTRNKEEVFSFRDVFLKGLAPDGGLFVPKKIPFFTSKELTNYKSFSYNELAIEIILKFCKNEFNETFWDASTFTSGLYFAEIKPDVGEPALVRVMLIR